MKLGVKVKLTDYKYLEPNGGGIYKITSPSNKEYIGKSINLNKRFCSYKRLDCNKQIKLYNSLVKYGVENHFVEIIENNNNSEYLNNKEIYYISMMGSNSLNITFGGDGGKLKYGTVICELLYGRNLEGESILGLSKTFNIDHRTIKFLIYRVGTPVMYSGISKKMKGVNKGNTYMLGKKHSKETKLKISKSKIGKTSWNKGVAHSEETKIKISKSKYQSIVKKALNNLGEIMEVIPKNFTKEQQKSEWHILCKKLYTQNFYQKKLQKLKENKV